MTPHGKRWTLALSLFTLVLLWAGVRIYNEHALPLEADLEVSR